MKVILALLLVGISLVFAVPDSNNFKFRVANHLGPDLPAALAVKACGLPNVYVNAKDSGRVGFGHDIDSQLNPNAGGLCSGSSCGGNKRVMPTTRDEDDSDPDVLYAGDSVVNFHVYWRADQSDPERVLTRISQGDVAYAMGPDSSLSIQSAGSATAEFDVPNSSDTVLAKSYPTAAFSFNGHNRVIMQNWYLEHAVAPSCTLTASNPNDLVSTYTVAGVSNSNIASLNFKSRVRFDFASDGAPNGLVNVYVKWNAATSKFEKHIVGESGASFAPNWVDRISVRVSLVDENTGSLTAIIDDNIAPTATYLQACSVSRTNLLLSKKEN